MNILGITSSSIKISGGGGGGTPCPITLVDYSGLVPTYQYPDVSGQVFSVTDETWEHQEVFLAGTNPAGIAIDWPADEVRIVQLNTRNSSFGYYEAFGPGSARYDYSATLLISNSAGTKSFRATLSNVEAEGDWRSVSLATASSAGLYVGIVFDGSILNPTPVAAGLNTRIALGVDGTGKIYIYFNGVEQTLQYFDGTFTEIAETNFFDPGSDTLAVIGQLSPLTSSSSMVPFVASIEGELITTGFADSYPANVRDWCGNTL